MRKLLLLTFAILMLPGIARAQWDFAGNFAEEIGTDGNGIHGVAVDGEGKIWVQPYGTTDSVQVPKFNNEYRRVAALYVYNPDGTQVDFSPIKFVTVGEDVDTLGGRVNTTSGNWETMTGRGLRADANGDILVSQGNILYRLNHETGEGMNKLVRTVTGSIAAAAVDEMNNVYVAPVVGGTPLAIYDEDFNFISNAIEATRGFSRAFEVSPDGNSIYWAGYSNSAVILYQRPDEFSSYDSIGVVIPGVDAESFGWNDETGMLWVGSGSPNDLPNDYVSPDGDTLETNYTAQAWYAFDPADLTAESAETLSGFAQPQDSILFSEPGIGRPRGIDFSADGMTAYVGVFSKAAPNVQVFTKGTGTAVEPKDPRPGKALALGQNAPNPFRASTGISFTLTRAGEVSLRVYDLLGRQVATLAEGAMSAGSYTASFDAAGLSSGAYLYVLEAEGKRLTKRMVVVK